MRTNAHRSRGFCIWILACLCSVVPIDAAWGQSALSFDIPAQDLVVALESFAAQADKEVLFDREQALGKQSAPIKGQLAPAQALRLLIAPSGLPLRQLNERTFVVGNARTASEGSVRLAQVDSPATPQSEDSADDVKLEEVLVFGTLKDIIGAGSKNGLALRDVPKSVTVVTRERIDVQNLNSLLDVLEQTTGVAVQTFGPVDNFYYSRGFQVQSTQIDGGAPANLYGFGSFLTPDTAQYERVEMLRGADGMYTGAGDPGGVINLVRKRARNVRRIEFNLSAGRWNDYRGEVDLTGPLTGDGRLRGRLVAAWQQNDYFRDRSDSQRALIYGTGEYDVTDSTLLIFGASYEDRKEDGYPFGGLPLYADGSDLKLPRSTALSPSWNRWDFTSTEIFARAEQKFGSSGVIKLNLTRFMQDSPVSAFGSYGAVDPLTLTGRTSYTFGGTYDGVQDLADLSVNGQASLFGRKHAYTFGADYSAVDGGGSRFYSLLGSGGAPYPDGEFDVFGFDPAAYPAPTGRQLNTEYPQWKQSQKGVYATLGLQLADALRLTVGGRYAEYSFLNVQIPVDEDGTRGDPYVVRNDDSRFIPSAALSYDFSEQWSAYASYGETYQVQADTLRGPPPGRPLDPVTGAGYEIGVKGEVFSRLNAALALYRVERNGEAVDDPLFPPTPGPNGSNCCYLPQADVTREGFDAEVSGTVVPGWQMFAGYTYGTSDFEGGETDTTYYLNLTPKHLLKVWTTWQLPGTYSRWTLSGGVVAQSEIYVSGFALAAPGSSDFVPFRFTQDDYSLWNASIQYRLGDTWTIGLYGENLFDKTYYSAIEEPGGATYYGTPRSYVLNIRGRW